jgi:hypothetical protein
MKKIKEVEGTIVDKLYQIDNNLLSAENKDTVQKSNKEQRDYLKTHCTPKLLGHGVLTIELTGEYKEDFAQHYKAIETSDIPKYINGVQVIPQKIQLIVTETQMQNYVITGTIKAWRKYLIAYCTSTEEKELPAWVNIFAMSIFFEDILSNAKIVYYQGNWSTCTVQKIEELPTWEIHKYKTLYLQGTPTILQELLSAFKNISYYERVHEAVTIEDIYMTLSYHEARAFLQQKNRHKKEEIAEMQGLLKEIQEIMYPRRKVVQLDEGD